jgi:signal transduction histidine kinase
MLSGTINHLSSQLQKIERLRKELIANVSHEFKTPLSLIKGYAETIRDGENLSEEKRIKQLNIIIDESDKLNLMINEIMDLSQIQSDYYKLEKTEFIISETIKTVVSRLAYYTEDKKLHVEVDAKDDLWVYADERRIEQVLYNLLNNAINYSEKNHTIFIRMIDQDNLIVVEVEDQGAGMSHEEIPYIWDRFYKSKEVSTKHKGSGLGLAIVKGILDAHKSSFGVESDLGKGSKFWFEIIKSA